MSELFSARIKKLIDLEETVNGGVKNNKVANFSYTSNAYENNEAAGTDSFNISRDNNIPNANPVAIETDRTVLDRGYRSQGASLSRMLMNHFLGRTSYNLNKIHDWFTDLLKIVSEMSVKGFWDLTKDVDSSPNVPDFDVAAPGTYKGRDFSGITLSSLPEWIQQEPTDYGEWTLIVEQGFKFKRQFLYYTRSKNSAPEFGDYLAIRTFSYDDDREVYAAEQWTSKAVDADHALVSDTLKEGATMGGKDVATTDGTVDKWNVKDFTSGMTIGDLAKPENAFTRWEGKVSDKPLDAPQTKGGDFQVIPIGKPSAWKNIFYITVYQNQTYTYVRPFRSTGEALGEWQELATTDWKPKDLAIGANINGVAVATTEDVTNLTKDKATVAQVNAMFQYTASSKTLNIVPIR